MYIRNKELATLNTFGLPCIARSFFSFASEEELAALIRSGETVEKRVLVLGGGSNILFRSDFDGLVIHPVSSGISVEHIDDEFVNVNVAAGVAWDDFVEWSVNQGFGGVENLSYIPGQTGSAPVQNIGAYGSEVTDSILRVRCILLESGEAVELTAAECRHGYRDSIFKNELKGKTVVTSVCFRLARQPRTNLAYGEVAAECEKLGEPTPVNVRKAIISIRKRKLPDPKETGNAGSFFKNPVVTGEYHTQLVKDYPDIPTYRLSDGCVKLAAGWLIDQCGWKGSRFGNAGVHERQALVLINHGNATGEEIIDLAERIMESVRSRFGIVLCPEVEII